MRAAILITEDLVSTCRERSKYEEDDGLVLNLCCDFSKYVREAEHRDTYFGIDVLTLHCFSLFFSIETYKCSSFWRTVFCNFFQGYVHASGGVIHSTTRQVRAHKIHNTRCLAASIPRSNTQVNVYNLFVATEIGIAPGHHT